MALYHKQSHEVDVVVVGAGGAGLMAALELSAHVRTAVISKLIPVRSHTATAQGGIGAALGNEEPDDWLWHMFDTVKGSDYLADQDAAEVLAHDAIQAVYQLEHWGLPFDRTPDGRIAQRRFGGHTRDFGKAAVKRSCYAADHTGQGILQTLYQQCIKNGVTFFDEYFLLDLLVRDGVCCGAVAMCLERGDLHLFHAKAVLFATGGFGRMYKVTSNAMSFTGDGPATAFRRGIPLEDMEFFQFHPTGIYKLGILISEAVRGEGGILRNGAGERFMERYAPTLLDLAPRDIISRAIYQEIREGRGVDGKDYVLLDATPIGRAALQAKLPDISSFVRTYLGIDPAEAPIPVQPTAHYAMGGIATDLDGRVILDEKNTPMPGFYAAGECACVSVHGANRLGTNSLVDILVFGRRAAAHMLEYVRANPLTSLPPEPTAESGRRMAAILERPKGESPAAIRDALREVMMDKVSIFRQEEGLREALGTIRELKERYACVSISDHGHCFNQELQETLELGNLLDLAEVTALSALGRRESRGAHSREDFPKRDDANWLKHTLACRSGEEIVFKYKPVTITRFQPMERKY
jgi:succinate dehydrogenase / fumarate reductase flavoprotein subunit